MTAACKESLFEIWEDALWTHNLLSFASEMYVGSAVLALSLCKQFRKLNVSREDILNRHQESPYRNEYDALSHYAFLAGHLITDDGLDGNSPPEVPKDALPDWGSPDREWEWARRILIERGLSGDKTTMQPSNVKS